MGISRRQLGLWSITLLSSGCQQPKIVDTSAGPPLEIDLRLLMRTTAGTARPVAAETPVFAGDELAFRVTTKRPMHVAVIDMLETPQKARARPAVAISDNAQVPATEWISLLGRAPKAIVGVVATRAAMASDALIKRALLGVTSEGWDENNAAFDPAYAVGASARGLPRRRFLLRGRRLTRQRAGDMRVAVPGDHDAVVAVLIVEHVLQGS